MKWWKQSELLYKKNVCIATLFFLRFENQKCSTLALHKFTIRHFLAAARNYNFALVSRLSEQKSWEMLCRRERGKKRLQVRARIPERLSGKLAGEGRERQRGWVNEAETLAHPRCLLIKNMFHLYLISFFQQSVEQLEKRSFSHSSQRSHSSVARSSSPWNYGNYENDTQQHELKVNKIVSRIPRILARSDTCSLVMVKKKNSTEKKLKIIPILSNFLLIIIVAVAVLRSRFPPQYLSSSAPMAFLCTWNIWEWNSSCIFTFFSEI